LAESSGAAPRLFDDGGETPEDVEEQWVPASRAIDSIVEKFGHGLIGPASSLDARRPGENPFGPESDAD
jgi:hypothetical protein